jgi:hypothetical protein
VWPPLQISAVSTAGCHSEDAGRGNGPLGAGRKGGDCQQMCAHAARRAGGMPASATNRLAMLSRIS